MSAIRRELKAPIPHRTAEVVAKPARTHPYKPIWESSSDIAGTLAADYLYDVRGFTFTPRDIRYHPRCPRGKGRDVSYHPALLIGVFKQGRLIAVQRIFLDPATARYTHKMMLGDSRGGSWPSSYSSDHMSVAEGFETAVAYQQITEMECGTCFGNKNFSIFEPPAAITRITLLPDNDPEGLAMAATALQVRKGQGFQVRQRICPPLFNDWATILQPASAKAN